MNLSGGGFLKKNKNKKFFYNYKVLIKSLNFSLRFVFLSLILSKIFDFKEKHRFFSRGVFTS